MLNKIYVYITYINYITYIANSMKIDKHFKGKIAFTLNGRKNTYFRRFDNITHKPLFTTNIYSAHIIKGNDIPNIIKETIINYGKDNVKDIKLIKDDTK